MSKEWPSGEIKELLSKHNFILHRDRKHQVWRNPDGLVFVLSNSPGDVWAYANALGDLKRVVGFRKEPRQQNKPIKKRVTVKKVKNITVTITSVNKLTLAEQLKVLWQPQQKTNCSKPSSAQKTNQK